MSACALIHTTFPSRAEADRVVRALLAEELIACANILMSCTSIYRWEGKIEANEEVPVLFKTRPELAEAVAARIEALHPYDVPVVERWQAQVSPAAEDWIRATTRD